MTRSLGCHTNDLLQGCWRQPETTCHGVGFMKASQLIPRGMRWDGENARNPCFWMVWFWLNRSFERYLLFQANLKRSMLGSKTAWLFEDQPATQSRPAACSARKALALLSWMSMFLALCLSSVPLQNERKGKPAKKQGREKTISVPSKTLLPPAKLSLPRSLSSALFSNSPRQRQRHRPKLYMQRCDTTDFRPAAAVVTAPWAGRVPTHEGGGTQMGSDLGNIGCFGKMGIIGFQKKTSNLTYLRD